MKRTRQQFARGMRAIVCGEEWVIKKVIKKVGVVNTFPDTLLSDMICITTNRSVTDMSKPGPIPTEYTAIMTGEPFLHFESKIVAQMRLKGLSNNEIRELVKADNSFQYKTTKSIARVLKAVLRRLDVLDDRLVELCAHGNLSSSRIVTLFAIAKTNLLFFEFLEEVYREKCALGNTPLTAKDVRIFFTQKSQQSPLVANWSEGTIRKLRQVYLKTMIDSGLVIPDEPVSASIIDEELYEHLKVIGEYRFLAALTGGM